MDDLHLIASLAPERGPDDAARRRAEARLAERIAGARPTVRSAPRLARPRRRLIGVSAAAAGLAAGAAVAGVLLVGSPAGDPAVPSAYAAVNVAAAVTADSARLSGSAVVRITHDGGLWAGSTIGWRDGDLAVSSDAPRRSGKAGPMLLVDGTIYGLDPSDGGWVEMGSPASIDPGSGTTPAEYLAAIQEDVGGATLRRITEGMHGLTTRPGDDGSTVYSGTVAAGLVTRETGFKEGQAVRVLPFGFVAHDEAADPRSPLDVELTVGGDGLIRRIAVDWGTAASAWTYVVEYGDLGTAPPIAAPADATPLERARDAQRAAAPGS